MPLIITPPGSYIDPFRQSRKIGAYISLSDLNIISSDHSIDSELFFNEIAEAIKDEFITQIKDFCEGKRVPCVRRLPAPEIISK